MAHTTEKVDPEFDAMGKVFIVLEALPDVEARERVMAYVSSRFGLKIPVSSAKSAGLDQVAASEPILSAQTLPDLFEAVEPSGEAAKVLTVAYWIQVVQGSPEWESLAINMELKHLGHGVSNITKVFDRLIAKRPQLVLQTRKSGSSQQARKKYKLTREGVKFIDERLAHGKGVNLD